MLRSWPGMPTRSIPKSHRSVTGRIASAKLGRPAEFESTLERDLLTLLEFDSQVLGYEEQPVTIGYTAPDGSSRSYTPDVLVAYRGSLVRRDPKRIELVEVKYRTDLFADWPRLKPKLRAGRAYSRERGWRFRILTEHEIRTPYLQNARFLLGYRALAVDRCDVETVTNALRRRPEVRIDQLLESISTDRWRRAELIPVLWHLVAAGALETDLGVPLTMHTVVRIGSEGEIE